MEFPPGAAVSGGRVKRLPARGVETSMFDRTVCLNLDRRPDRWASFCAGLPPGWDVPRGRAVDGQATGFPPWWQHTCGSWGCYRSHLRIWEDALADDVDSLLVFEDDAIFCEGFSEKLAAVLEVLPDDWDQLYLGGEYLRTRPNPTVHTRDVLVRCSNVNRTHAYAIRGRMLRAAYLELSEPTPPIENHRDQQVDYRLGRMHDTGKWNIYAPWRFLVGQRRSVSDVIDGPMRATTTQWFNQYPIEEPEPAPC